MLSKLLSDGGKILVVDPSDSGRALVKSFLSKLNLSHVTLVPSTKEAKRLMITNNYKLIICEWVMDGQNGIQFCREIRRIPKYQHVPFILQSSKNMKGDVVLASEVNIDRYLLKPFSFNAFVDKLMSICKQTLNPSTYDLHIRNGNIALLNERFDEAESYFSKAMDLNPKAAKAYLGKANTHFSVGNIDAAHLFVRSCLDLNPEYIEAHRILLHIYEAQGNKDGVIKEATYLNQLSPDNPYYLIILAQNFLEQGNVPRAEQLFKRILINSPRIAKAHKGLGDISFDKGDYEKAEKHYQKAIDIEPSDISTLNQLALTLVKKGQYANALSMYQACLEIDADNPKVLFNMGISYEELGNTEEAIKCYESAVFQDPGYKKATKAIERLKKSA